MDNTSLFFLIFGLSQQLYLLDLLMIFGAEYLIYLILLIMLIAAIKGREVERKSFILFLISFPILVLIIKSIHLFFFEQRPFITEGISPLINYPYDDASFPSRHTAISFALAISFMVFKSRWGTLFLISAFWISISRIYVGVHYPLDILGGIAVGLLSVIIAKEITKFLKAKLFQ